MSKLLDSIVRDTKKRIAERAMALPRRELERMVSRAEPTRSLSGALKRCDFSVIGEHKRRSPSIGVMDSSNVSQAYSRYAKCAWVSSISVLTEQDHFDGHVRDLQIAREQCGSKPILRKDFIVDEYQVLEARAFGADAILLMTTLHAENPSRIQRLFDLATDIGLESLVEIGMEEDPKRLMSAVPQNALILGINSRRFSSSTRWQVRMRAGRVLGHDFSTAKRRHEEFRWMIPDGKIAVAESGLLSANDLQKARQASYNAALVGTAFLKGRPIDNVIKEFEQAIALRETSWFIPHPRARSPRGVSRRTYRRSQQTSL